MGDSGKKNNNKENTPPVYILLPICIESTCDVFLNILRNVVARSKLDDNVLDHALKSGMTAETFAIDSDDIVTHWKELNSKSKQIRQSKMLGYWAIQNFSSLGKKLFGESWQAPERKCVEVVGKGSMKPDEIDDVIFTKMKLRVIELTVSQSTLAKLKYFVKVPIDIRKCNDLQISPKMRSFDIETENLQHCWDALKRGRFSLKDSINVAQTLDLCEPLTSHHSMDKHTVNSANSSQSAKRVHLDRNTDIATNTFGDSTTGPISTETFRMVLIETQKHIGNLNKWLDPNVVGHDSERGEKLHLMMIIRQNDETIREMKLAVDENRKEIENLRKEKTSLKAQVETNIGLISALTKGVEANSKLYLKSEADLAASVGSIAQYEYKIGTLESDVRLTKDKSLELELHNQNLNDRLVDAENVKVEMTNKNKKLEEELSVWKNYAVTTEKQLEEVVQIEREKTDDNTKLEEKLKCLNSHVATMVPELQQQIANLERNGSEMKDKNKQLEEELSVWKNYAATTEKQLKEAVQIERKKTDDNTKLEEKLKCLNSHVATMVPELQQQIANLERNGSEMKDKNKQLEEELSVWKNYAATTEKQLKEAVQIERKKTDDNTKLEEKLKCLNSHVATMVPELQQQIANLERNGSEMTDKNKQLEEELSVWKNYAATTEKQLEEAVQIERKKTDDNTKLEEKLKCLNMNSHVATMVPGLTQQIENLERNMSEMTDKNENMEGESVWKNGKLKEKVKEGTCEETQFLVLSLPEAFNSDDCTQKSGKANDPEQSLETLRNRNETEFTNIDENLDETPDDLVAVNSRNSEIQPSDAENSSDNEPELNIQPDGHVELNLQDVETQLFRKPDRPVAEISNDFEEQVFVKPHRPVAEISIDIATQLFVKPHRPVLDNVNDAQTQLFVKPNRPVANNLQDAETQLFVKPNRPVAAISSDDEPQLFEEPEYDIETQVFKKPERPVANHSHDEDDIIYEMSTQKMEISKPESRKRKTDDDNPIPPQISKSPLASASSTKVKAKDITTENYIENGIQTVADQLRLGEIFENKTCQFLEAIRDVQCKEIQSVHPNECTTTTEIVEPIPNVRESVTTIDVAAMEPVTRKSSRAKKTPRKYLEDVIAVTEMNIAPGTNLNKDTSRNIKSPVSSAMLANTKKREPSKTSGTESGALLTVVSEAKEKNKVFETDDPIVKQCRDNLLTRRFGWIRFYSNKNCKAAPGFVYPPDEDGIIRAQKVTANGYVSNSKNIFFGYEENIPESEKDKADVAALNKLNKKFNFSFV